MISKPFALIDLDNTVSDWAGWVSKKLGNPGIPGKYKMEDRWGLTSLEASKLVYDCDGYHSADLEAIPGAKEKLWEIHHKGYIIKYVSAAPQRAQRGRYFWLADHGFPSAIVIHTGNSQRKTEWIRLNVTPRYKIAIDDSPYVLDMALFQGVEYTYLLDKDYNRENDPDSPQHIRVRAWSEITV